MVPPISKGSVLYKYLKPINQGEEKGNDEIKKLKKIL